MKKLFEERQPQGFLLIRIDMLLEKLSIGAAAAHPIGELADELRVGLNVIFFVRNFQCEFFGGLFKIRVGLSNDDRQPIGEALACFQRGSFLHILAMKCQRADRQIGAAKHIQVCIRIQIPVQMNVGGQRLALRNAIIAYHIHRQVRAQAR